MSFHSTTSSVVSSRASDTHRRPLDVGAFPAFSALLDASQEYARLSGCRFRSRSFDGLHKNSTDRSKAVRSVGASLPCYTQETDADSKTIAMLAANNAIQEFTKRVRSGEDRLVQELDDACRLAMEEGVRNGMVTTCQRLALWPPSATLLSAQPPALGPHESLSKEGCAERLPVTAQRLYEEEMERHAGRSGAARRARTAAFLADFSDAAGAAQPPMPDCQANAFHEFTQTALRWEQQVEESELQTACSFVTDGSGSGKCPSSSGKRESLWFSIPAFAAASVLVHGVSLAAAQALEQSSCKRRKSRDVQLLPVAQWRRAAAEVGA